MAMTGAAAFDKYKVLLAGLGITFDDADSEAIMTALFQAMVYEMKANADITHNVEPHMHLGSRGEVN